MKTKTNRFIAVLLAFALLLNIFPVVFFAEDAEPMTIKVSSTSAFPGSDVNVTISLENNPGIASCVLSCAYDSALTLTAVTVNDSIGGTFTPPPLTANPVTLNWYSALADVNGDFVFFTLSFHVDEAADEGHEANITITYDPDNIYNLAEDNINTQVINGKVTISSYVAGDINGDGKVNNKDLTRLAQYFAGWDVEVSEPVIDVNGDGKVNNKDLTRLAQYLAGWDVELPAPNSCVHNLEMIPAKAVTCTEDGNIQYWRCTKCGKLFSDGNGNTQITQAATVIPATGHSIVVDPYEAPTYESCGHTEGSHCGICGIVIVPQEEIPPLQKDSYAIEYVVALNDSYLQSLTIDNPNPLTYTTQDGIAILHDLTVAGYEFLGWYTTQSGSGTPVTSIPVGSSGNKKLYARWQTVPYTLTFDSPLVPMDPITYTVNTGATWGSPSLAGYNFIGWCDDNNNLVTSLPVGTTGHITLHANWTSKRNQTRPVKNYGDPMIFEDTENGKVLFVYEIGTVENIPLVQLTDVYQNVNGIKQTFTTRESAVISSQVAKTIANTISHSTTNSRGWSLSSEWNDITTYDEGWKESTGKTDEELNEMYKTQSGNYTVNSSSGGSHVETNATGISGKISSSQTVTDSTTYYGELELGATQKIDGKLKADANVSGNMGVPLLAKAKAGASAGVEIGLSNELNEKITVGASRTLTQSGTTSKELAVNMDHSSSDTATWNSSKSYSASNEVGQSQSIKNVLSKEISSTKDIGVSHGWGENESQSRDHSQTDSSDEHYQDVISFNNETVTEYSRTVELGGTIEGYYRFVLAGKAHVFAIVGYDVATASFFTSSYTVMEDDTYTFIDYSAVTPSFDDNEWGVLPFEVPVDIREYVDARILRSEGLIVSQEGIVTGYIGTEDEDGDGVREFDNFVIIPSYYRMDNLDGTYTSIKITGISPNAFRNNTEIIGISLSSFITDIPANAFSGCTNLQTVLCENVQTIGANAFSGCTSLDEFNVPDYVTSIGTNAFNGINKITVDASSKDVAIGALNSGAKEIVLTISKASSTITDTKFNVPSSVERFELRGNNQSYNDIEIVSDAAETVLNGLNITNTTGIPLTLSSSNVTFNRVTINCPSIVAILKADATDIKLYATNTFNSNGEIGIVSKTIKLSPVENTISSILNVSKETKIFGGITGSEYLNGTFSFITADEYDLLKNGSMRITFDPNGGTLSGESTKVVYCGSPVGALPVPTRARYTFDGWFTEASGGTQITAQTIFNIPENVTLYAHWSAIYVTSLQIVTQATTRTFYVGDTFSSAGLVVKAIYNDGTAENVTCSVSSPNMTTAGTKTVTVSYGGKSTSYTITVNALTISVSVDASTASNGYMTVNVTAPRGTITYSSNNTNVATVNSSGKIALTGRTGTTTITATANNNGCTVSASKTITISNTSGTKYKETSTSTSSSVYYASLPDGYTTSMVLLSGNTLPTYSTNLADYTGSSSNTSTGRVDINYTESGTYGYVYYQWHYSATPTASTASNIYRIINYKQGNRNVQGTTYPFNKSLQFFSTTDYREHGGNTGGGSNQTGYAPRWAYEDTKIGHPWYVAEGIQGTNGEYAYSACWYRFPIQQYTKTTTTYTYYYYTIS